MTSPLAQQLLEELADYNQELGETVAVAQQTAELEQAVESHLAQKRSENELPETVSYEMEREVRAARPIKLLEKLWDYQASPYMDLKERCDKMSGAITAFLLDIRADIHAPTYTRYVLNLVAERSYQPDALIRLMYSDDCHYLFLKQLQYAIEDKIVRNDKMFYRWAKKPVVPFNWKNWRHWFRAWERFNDQYLQELPAPDHFDSPDDLRYAPMMRGFSYNPLQQAFEQQHQLALQAEQQEQNS